jgi:tRNA-binding EMAP/Myf-like protein
MIGFERLSRTRGVKANVLLRIAPFAAAGLLLASCAGGAGPSMGDRFSQLFGGSDSGSTTQAQLVGTPPAPFAGGDSAAGGQGVSFQDCPGVAIREGASTLQVGIKPGPVTDNNEVRYQGTITRNARDCTLFGGQVNARVGIQGRIIVGPAGAPASVDVPLRVAVVQEGVQPKTIATKLYRTTVDLGGQDNVAFSFVAEDMSFPVPPPEAVASYVIYIGFDPEGARTPPPRQRGKGQRAR